MQAWIVESPYLQRKYTVTYILLHVYIGKGKTSKKGKFTYLGWHLNKIPLLMNIIPQKCSGVIYENQIASKQVLYESPLHKN